jgi:hypothetical protein
MRLIGLSSTPFLRLLSTLIVLRSVRFANKHRRVTGEARRVLVRINMPKSSLMVAVAAWILLRQILFHGKRFVHSIA